MHQERMFTWEKFRKTQNNESVNKIQKYQKIHWVL